MESHNPYIIPTYCSLMGLVALVVYAVNVKFGT
jgi:hypothetical protein